VAHLSGQLAGGYNYNAGAVLQPGNDVYNDYSVDQVYGGAGADWVFLSGSSSSDPYVLPDVLNDQDGSDQVTMM